MKPIEDLEVETLDMLKRMQGILIDMSRYGHITVDPEPDERRAYFIPADILRRLDTLISIRSANAANVK